MSEEYVKPYTAKKIDAKGETEMIEMSIARESAIEVYLNGKRFTTLLASPAEFKELAVGHLITEGILSFEDIVGVKEEEDGSRVEIETANPDTRRSKEGYPHVNSEAVFDVKATFEGMEYLESKTYRLTRGTHLAALVDQSGKMVARSVDVGRHNAVDKMVGKAFLEGLPLPELYLLSTGRQPAYMVLKAARAGIPLIVTKAVPLDSGVEAARKANIGLVGKLSRESMLVFANEWRIRI